MEYDLVIRSGRLFDAQTGSWFFGDLWVRDGKMYLSAEPGASAAETVDASGCDVLPGLIDEHLHINYKGNNIGANPDPLCLPCGVTTACDAGTTGIANFEPFGFHSRLYCQTSVLCYLHVNSYGLQNGLGKVEESHQLTEFSEPGIRAMFDRYPDFIRGLKVRVCKATTPAGLHLDAVKRAVEIADAVNWDGHFCTVDVHYGDLPEDVSLEDLLETLRPGDILSHVFQNKGETILNSDGHVRECVREAQRRGIYLDDCHGRPHWSFPIIEQALADSVKADILSSDTIYASAYTRPAFSLLHAMCVLSAAGARTEDIYRAVTVTPAKALGISDWAGQLGDGRPADITILREIATDQVFEDYYGNSRPANKVFLPLMTIRSGKVAYRQIFF